MTIDVSTILKELGGKIDINGDVEMSDTDFLGEMYHFNEPVKVSGSVSNNGKSLILKANCTGHMTTQCARCMKDIVVDIDFDIDEFMNIDTVKALEKARDFEAKKNKETSDIEDYIDSLVIELRTTNEYVMNLTVRKFWRYIKRVNKHEQYEACLNGQMSGMATFKEPIEHWMTSIEVKDKYENLKTDEGELREKIG